MEEQPKSSLPDSDNEVVERIDKSKIIPLNDPDCQHDPKIMPGDCGIPGHVAIGCHNCPLGVIVREDSLPTLTALAVKG